MKLNFLGVGTASAIDVYNASFTIHNDNKYFLVDTGGGNYILSQLKKSNIDICDINNIFLSHIHLDHCLGLLWIIRVISKKMDIGEYIGNLNIYASKSVISDFLGMMKLVLKKPMKKLGDRINFIEIYDGQKEIINKIEYEFIDTNPIKTEMFGFIAREESNSVIFVGDEPLKPSLFERCKNCTLLIHESFCLDREKEELDPYRKSHCTAKDAAINAQNINANKLLIFHTMDNDLKNRKRDYIKEAEEYFDGEVFVPDDLEEVII